ncbi:MAG: hypothetical protein H7316_10470 [Tardiphaga sp.]|uniref:hypothetical protein n=1 Tax=Tardiphaga sp. TaxID=1926292 RepID=UPI0019B08E36|nr:hypothetical protein [Tardiphaga sp.]MBC7584160.1 hypothetical protein [Tardiphaga sp.]
MTDPPSRRRTTLTDEALANMRYRYVETDESAQSIADSLHINRDTITQTAKRFGWPLRRDRPRELPAALRVAAPAVDDAAIELPDDPALAALPLAQRLEQAVLRELAKVERRRSDGVRPAEAERIARTLSTLTQTLFKVRALREPGSVSADAQHDDMPADLDGFRDALARRIEAFVASRADDGLAGAGEPPGPASPAA